VKRSQIIEHFVSFPQDVDFKYSSCKQVHLSMLAFPSLKLKSSLTVVFNVSTHTYLFQESHEKQLGWKKTPEPKVTAKMQKPGKCPAAGSALDGYLKGAKCLSSWTPHCTLLCRQSGRKGILELSEMQPWELCEIILVKNNLGWNFRHRRCQGRLWPSGF
jgi:hypothetical protein